VALLQLRCTDMRLGERRATWSRSFADETTRMRGDACAAPPVGCTNSVCRKKRTICRNIE